MDISLTEKANTLLHFVVKDALAMYMSRKEAGAALMGELAAQVRRSPTLAEAQGDTAKEVFAELRATLEGLSALVQTTAVSQPQLAALESLSNKELPTAMALVPLLQGDFWSRKTSEVWKTAGAETFAQPAIEEAMEHLNGGTGDPWSIVQARLPKWQKECRPGATALLEQTCLKQLLAETSELLAVTERDHTWVEKSEACRSRMVWLQTFGKLGNVDAEALRLQLAQVTETLSATNSCLKLRAGLDLAKAFEALPSDSEEMPDFIKSMLAAFQDCRGLTADGSDADILQAALERLREKVGENQATRPEVELALAIVRTIQPGPDGRADSPARARAAEDWQKTLLGLNLQDLVGKVPEDGRIPPLAVLDSIHAAMESFIGCAGTVVGDAGAIEGAQQELTDRRTAAAQVHAAKSAEAAEAAIVALEEKAGGGSAAGTSWKAALTDTSSWEEIEREAKHHLKVAEPGLAFVMELDSVCVPAVKAVEAWRSTALALGLTPESELTRRAAQAIKLARTTNTEAFLADVLCNVRADKRGGKIRHRILSMAKHSVSQDDILHGLWKRAQATAMSS